MATPAMNPDEAEEYTAGLGQCVGGNYRLVKLGVELGVPDALGLTVPQWVEGRLGGYVRLALEERQQAAKELTGDGFTQRETADILGISPATVNRDVSNETNGDSDQGRSPDSVSNETPPQPPPPLEESMAKLDQAAAYRDLLAVENEERERAEQRTRDESTAEMNELRDVCRRLLNVLPVVEHLPAHEQTEAEDWLRQLRKEITRHARHHPEDH
jgi:hypothetical protein